MRQGAECRNNARLPDVDCPIALVALGSNLPSRAGSPRRTLDMALQALDDSPMAVRAVSRFYATPCFPAGSGPDYVNAVAALDGSGDAAAVLDLLHRVEADFDRQRVARWGQRTLDLDLLAVGDTVLPDLRTQTRWREMPVSQQAERAPTGLILPHPRLQDRAFVLVPLCDVAPDWMHPVLGRTATQLRDSLPARDVAAVRVVE